MPSLNETGSKKMGKAYWRSLDEVAGTPAFQAFLHREFPAHASEWMDPSRRGFLKLMAASFALAGVAGCVRYPEEKINEYAHRPVNRNPGVPVHYTTGYELGGVAQGLLVKSIDGRPIKIEGNPKHPLNQGATDVYAQATLLDLYDPERSRVVMKGLQESSWDDFLAASKDLMTGSVAVLTEASCSPSYADVRGRLAKKYGGVTFYEYEPASFDNAVAGLRLAFGKPYRPVYELAKADVIVALDADLFTGDPLSTKYSRDFAAGRQLRDPGSADGPKAAGEVKMNRLYAFEPLFTNTGAMADHREAVASKDIAAVALAIAAGVGVAGASGGSQSKWVKAAVKDLQEAKEGGGAGVVVVGPRQPAEVHALAAAINEALGSAGKAVVYTEIEDRPHHVEAIKALADGLNAGKVDTLLIVGGNPAYDAPADLKFGGAMKKAKKGSVHLSHTVNETSKLASWQLPRTHYLESWGDVKNYDGTVTVAQPLIDPIFDGKSAIEVLALLAGDENAGGLEIVQRTAGLKKEDWNWKQGLFNGVLPGEAAKFDAPKAKLAGLPEKVQALVKAAEVKPREDATEVIVYSDLKVYDGRFANNGWLQELPDPMTKLTWDNAALMNPAMMAELGVAEGDMVSVTLGSGGTQAAALSAPGQAPGTVALALGYGRTDAGNIGGTTDASGAHTVGFNAYSLRTTATPWFGKGSVAKAAGSYKFSTTQDHHPVSGLDGDVGQKRYTEGVDEAIHETSFAEFKRTLAAGEGGAAKPKKIFLSLFNEPPIYAPDKPGFPQHRWGMSIDLTTCVGCSACTIACQAENNIPIVGKEQVAHGREMHWIRVDRYYSGDDVNNPEGVAYQPVPCMHCETAPCEEVCPVGATTHSQEGLNQMVYNRCIGTRYCSNNCPYKVRRFNFFDYNNGNIKTLYTPNILRPEQDKVLQMVHNPDVTVRMRGVMEKCTYCAQRIENARIQRNIKARSQGAEANDQEAYRIKDGDVVTACQQVCPTSAIVFGDLNDPKSKVSQMHGQGRTFDLLADLNTKPRTKYLARVKNTSPELVESTPAKEG